MTGVAPSRAAESAPELRVQIVIPVHTLDRPIRRAVSSVLADPQSGVIVVAHNIEPATLDVPDDQRLTFVELTGDRGRPGAAFDAGIAAATAEWVGIMGSDDWFDPGALRAMRHRGEHDRAAIVLAPLAYQGGARGFVPQTMRRKKLRAARDRLFYRTAPLGLIRTRIMQRAEYRFGSVFPVGSDVFVGARLWTRGHSISFDPLAPAYVVGADARTRTTTTPRPLAEHGAAWLAIWDEPWLAGWDARTREALAVKIMRVHVLGAVTARPRTADWADGDFAWLASLAARIRSECPHVLRSFRAASVDTLNALLAADLEGTLAAAERESGALSLRQMLPARLIDACRPDGPVRRQLTTLGYTIVRRVSRRQDLT